MQLDCLKRFETGLDSKVVYVLGFCPLFACPKNVKRAVNKTIQDLRYVNKNNIFVLSSKTTLVICLCLIITCRNIKGCFFEVPKNS